MYKVTTKKGSFVFSNLDDAIHFIVFKSGQLFDDNAFIKISFLEDIEE